MRHHAPHLTDLNIYLSKQFQNGDSIKCGIGESKAKAAIGRHIVVALKCRKDVFVETRLYIYLCRNVYFMWKGYP